MILAKKGQGAIIQKLLRDESILYELIQLHQLLLDVQQCCSTRNNG